MHGGTVEAASEGPGRGSEFVVRLPIPALGDNRHDEQGASRELPAGPARRILVVDDNRDAAESLSLMLTLMGNEVRTAFDGYAALTAADDFRPEVVLLDIGLPALDGYEVCRRMRQQDWSRDVLIVALTGWGQDEDRRRSERAGFDHHLVKPVEMKDLGPLLARAEP
jgi:DNA-binding response OmpR family regulator